MSRKPMGLIAALAVVIALVALISPASAGVSSVGIGSATVAPGANATVALSASATADDGTANGDPGDGLGAWQVNVGFDTANLIYVACTSLSSGVCANPSSGVVRFTGANVNGLTGAIELGTVTFAAGSTEGTYPLDATLMTLTDPTGEDILGVTAGDGTITITQPTPSPTPSPSPTATPAPSPTPTPIRQRWGDVNCDGVVNAVDALAILRKVAVLPVFQVAPCPAIGAWYP